MSRLAYSIVCVVMVGILLAVSLAACGAKPMPTLTPASTPLPATDTPVPPADTPVPPTATPLPIPTPAPTSTPTPTIAVSPTPIPTPEMALATYTSTQYPFAIQYPAEWPELPSDETVTAQYGGAFAGLAVAEEDLVAVELGETTLEEYVDLVLFVLSSSLEDFELISRREGVNEQELPIQVIEFSAGVGGPLKASRLIYVHESGVAFSATYFAFGDRYQDLESLIAYAFSTFEVTATTAATADTAIAGLVDCEGAGDDFVAYGDDELGIGFCYPSGWVVDDTVEVSGFVSLSPQGFGPGKTLSDCLVLIYPHEMVAQFSEPTAEAEEILGLGFTFFAMIVQDATTDEWPSTTSIDGQEVATLAVRGTVEGEAVLGRLSAIKREEAMGMAISYVLDEEAYRSTAEAVMDSIVVALPVFAQAGEVRPMALNEFQEGSWTADQAGLHSFHVEGGTPVLFISQLLAQGGMDDKADLRILGPEGVFVEQFTTGWIGAQTYTSDSETFEGLVQNNVFGYLQPDALRVVLEETGEYTIDVSGGTMWHDEGKYRLIVLDMRAGAPGVLDIVEGELAAGEAYEYGVDGAANRSTIAYLRPIGPQAENLTLSLELLDEDGQSLEERHNYSYSGDDAFLHWVPRDDVPYSVRVTEIDGQPAQFELTMLQEPGDEEPEFEGLLCDQYKVEIEVQEDGALQVEEQQAFVSTEEGTRAYSRTLQLDGATDIVGVEVLEGNEVYAEGDSAEAGTYRVMATDDAIEVQWHALSAPGSSTMFTLRYTVVGGVQTDAQGRDIVTWQAMQPDRDYRIRDGLILVRLPVEVEVHEIIAFGAQGTGNADCDSFDAVITDEVTFELSHDLLPGQGMEIRVEYGPE